MNICHAIKARAFLLLLFVIGLPGLASALGIRIADQDPVATARGNAFVATADNPSAIYYNPAGISQMEGQNVRAGLYLISLGSQYTSAGTGAKTETKNDIQIVPQLYYTIALKSLPLSFGLGVYSPYGLSLEWPESSGFRTLAIKGRISYLTLNPVASYQVLPTLSVAMGPTINYADALIRQGIAGPGDSIKFKGDDTDVGFNAGILWRPHPKHALGVSYRSPTTMDFSGHSDIRNLYVPAPFFPPSGSEPATTRFKFPENVVLGWSFRPTPHWNLEFDFDWTDWDRLDSVTIHRASGALPTQPFQWRSSSFYEWGVTRYLDNGFQISGGYIYSENSVPDAFFNPLIPDSDRHIFSVGIGRKYKQMRWDAAYQFAYGPPRTVGGSLSSAAGESANGRYLFVSHAFTLSLGYGF